MLEGKKCVPCEGGLTPLALEEAEKLLLEIPGWTITPGGTAIMRKYTFNNFAEALAFVNRVGAIAEDEGHHPDIVFGWGYAEITLMTHAISGLHDNDFVIAKQINALQ